MTPLRRITHVLGLMVTVGLLLAACAPAPTAVPPTAVPATPTELGQAATAVPATAVPPTKAPTLAPPTAVPPTAEPTPDLLAQVAAFQEAYDQQDVDRVLALFVEEPNLSLLFGPWTGYASTSSLPAVRNNLEFQFALNTRLEATDCSTKNDKVSCVLLMKDDCTPPSVDAYHFHSHFTITDGKIADIIGRWDSSEEQAFYAYDAIRLVWARENLPEEAALYSHYPDALSGETSSLPDEWGKFIGIGEQGTGKLTATEFGQLVERICAGYTAASQ